MVFSSVSVAYNESLSSYWSTQEQSVRPTCVVTPTTSLDVVLAVSLLNVGGEALPGECDFAVRSGGYVYVSSTGGKVIVG